MTTLTEVFPRLAPAGSRESDLLVVGDTGVDLLVQVDDLPRRDSKSIGQSLGIFGGGMGANFAASARRSADDLAIALVSRVGDDAFGRACLDDLRDRRIDATRVAVMAGELTWWCAVAIAADGEKSLLGGRTPASLPSADQVAGPALNAARWMHVLADVPGSEDLVQRALAAGAIASVDIEGSFVRTDPARAARLARTADLVVLNTESLRGVTGREGIDDALKALLGADDGQPGAVLLTLGTEGSRLAWRDGRSSIQTLGQAAVPVEAVRDTTGAGDSFAGAWIARALAGDDLGPALETAAQSAATTIAHFGARQGGLPRWTDRPSEEHQ